MMAGGFVDSDGVTWPTCPQCGKTHPCAELPPEQAEQMAQWERELAQYSHRSDSSGFAGRIGEDVLRALYRARLTNVALTIAYTASIEKRLALKTWLAARMNTLIAESHAVGQSMKCDGCAEATAIHQLLHTSAPGSDGEVE